MDGAWSGRLRYLAATTLTLCAVTAIGGCTAVSTIYWVIKDGKTYPAEFKGLKDKKVAVVCRGPMHMQFRHEAAAPSMIADRVNTLMKANLKKKIDLIDSQTVARFADEYEWHEFTEVGEALGADMVVAIELESFALGQGRSIHYGEATIRLAVYDMTLDGTKVYDPSPFNIKFPPTIGGIPADELSEGAFMELFIRYLADQVGRRFYDHDPRADYANGYGIVQ